MLKKIVLSIFSLSIAVGVFAQKANPLVNSLQFEKLQLLSSDFKKIEDDNRSKAFELAKKNNWITFKVDKEGTIISLQGIDDLGFPLYLKTFNNTIAAGTTRTNSLYTGGSLSLSLNGSSDNVTGKIGIWDGGSILLNHQEFVTSRIEQRDSPSSLSEHSTHVAGTIMAAGVYPVARGMAWGLKKLYAWDFNSDASEMTTAASTGLILSNHSYGYLAGWDYNTNTNPARWEWYGVPGATEDYKFGFYDNTARDWDLICYNAPYFLPVKSAGNNRTETGPAVGTEYYGFKSGSSSTMESKGLRPANISSNDGYDIISTTANAKNILTVGAIYGLQFGTNDASDVKIAPFSSWGPTDDGRIKPDIVADGVSVTSTSSNNTTAYATLSGTSMACPNVSGSLLLLQEYYSKLNSGNFMRSATLKGLVIQTADEAGNSLGPDYIYGWGLLNVEKAAQQIKLKDTKSIITERTLAQGEVYDLQVVSSGYGPLKATICWTDPQGAVGASGTINSRTPKLVNDLDLRIIKGTTSFLPWKLDPLNPSNAAVKVDNAVDNVEQITITDAAPGEAYTIRISHKGTLVKGPQSYSIIASGVGGAVYCTSSALSTADSRINQVQIGAINNLSNTACSAYSNFNTISTNLEAGKTYPFTISLGTCGVNQNKIAKLFVDWNSDGDFNDENESIATSGVINGNGDFSGNLIVPGNVIAGNSSILRIVLVETTVATAVTACGTYAKGETQDFKVNFIKSTADAGVIAFNNLADNLCVNAAQQFSVKIKNFGSATISNVPVTLILSSNSSIVKTITENYTGSIPPNYEVDFKLSGSFITQVGQTYTIDAKTVLLNDLVSTNNGVSKSFNISQPLAIASASVAECDNAQGFYLLNGTADGNIYWYLSPTDTTPIEVGNHIYTTTKATTYYAGLNDFKSYFGAVNKKQYSGGSYSNNFGPKPIITVKAPMLLDSALLYSSQSGKITFTVENIDGTIFSASTIDVQRTKTTTDVTTNSLIDDDVNDPGKVYKIGLEFPAAGTYYIGIEFNGATIFRSNVGVNNIPIRLGNDVITLTGAYSTSSGNPTIITNAYYYFYNMLFKSLGCQGASRIPVVLGKPVVTQTWNTLTSSEGESYQWYLNNVKIEGATAKNYMPITSGLYKVIIKSNTTDCQASSDNVNFVLSAIEPSDTAEINLKVYPIPAKETLNLSFDVLKKEDINISLTNIIGQQVLKTNKSGALGKFNQALSLIGINNGTYVLSVKIGAKLYTQKITIAK